jgi:histidine triad (HIT) family protein
MTAQCLFCRMASGEMDVPKLHDDEAVFAIRDINPRAPVHVLVIPKQHIADAREVGDEHGPTLGRMFAVARKVAESDGCCAGGIASRSMWARTRV